MQIQAVNNMPHLADTCREVELQFLNLFGFHRGAADRSGADAAPKDCPHFFKQLKKTQIEEMHKQI